MDLSYTLFCYLKLFITTCVRKLTFNLNNTSEISKEHGGIEESSENNKRVPKGTTTAHFVRFMHELLDIMDMDGGHIVVIS